MNKRQILVAVMAVAVIIFSSALIGKRYSKTGIKDTLGLNVVGEVAAEETDRVLDGKGQIVVIFFDPKGTIGSGFEFARRAFEGKIRQSKGISVLAKEVVPLVAPDVSNRAAELVKKHAAVDAIVLLGGTPSVSYDDFANLPRPLPKLVAVLTFGTEGTKRLLEEGVVTVAIENPVYPTPVAHQIRNARDIFASMFVVVTKSNLEALRLTPPGDTIKGSER